MKTTYTTYQIKQTQGGKPYRVTGYAKLLDLVTI